MDNGGQKPPRAIPQQSRIPLPRTTLANIGIEKSQDNSSSRRLSHIPRPLGTTYSRIRAQKPFVDINDEPSIPCDVGSVQEAKNRLPSGGLLQLSRVTNLDTTPSKTYSIPPVAGHQISSVDAQGVQNQRRKPRPSLSERTLETLSQIPPSPSPSRTRFGINNGSNIPMTPTRLDSSLRMSQSHANLRGRPASPEKPPPRPASRIGLPSKTDVRSGDPTVLSHTRRALADSEEFSTRSTPRTLFGTRPSSSSDKVKQVSRTRAPSGVLHQKRGDNSLYQREPNTKPQNTSEVVVKSDSAYPKFAHASKTHAGSDVAKRDGPLESSRASTGVRCPIAAGSVSSLPSVQSGDDGIRGHTVNERVSQPHSKLYTLRETIAKAKAAKRAAVDESIRPTHTSNITARATSDSDLHTDDHVIEHGERTLHSRVRGAVTTGVLNIAAMGLKTLPKEMLGMYDFDPDSKSSWSEAVDLTKITAADNEITELPDSFFPDWSVEELEADEDKSNQFGGLQVLDLRGNLLTKVPIGMRRLQQLRVLNLSRNKFALDAFEIICEISSLTELRLSNNQMEGGVPLAMKKLTELTVLDLHNNRLSMLPHDLSVLQQLRTIDISDNKFVTLPLETLQSLPLKVLNMSKNSLSGTLMEGSFVFAELQVLDVASNQLRSLCNGRFDLPKLQSLNCGSNQLTSLPDLSLLQSLTALAAPENKIRELPQGFACISSLYNVDLSANEIRDLDPSIARLENLTALNIIANPLRERKFLSMSTSDLKTELAKRVEAAQSGPNGNTLDSNDEPGHDLRGIADNTGYKIQPRNGTLDFTSQNLSSVTASAVDLTQPIHTIRLSTNSLTHLPSDLLYHPNVQPFLQVLDMSHNPLLDPTMCLEGPLNLPALKSLYIVSTGLTSLEALTTHLVAPRLQELNISCHRLSGPIPALRAYFPSLTTLLATDNWFSSIEVEHIRGLEVLDVRNNRLDRLPPKIGELGGHEGSRSAPGRLHAFECSGNLFRVPRLAIIEKGTEAVLKDLRRMVPAEEVGDEWQ